MSRGTQLATNSLRSDEGARAGSRVSGEDLEDGTAALEEGDLAGRAVVLDSTVSSAWKTSVISQRQASPHTVAAYRDAVRLLLLFASSRSAKPLSKLDFADLNAPTIAAFLDYLERERANSVRSRNARLAAIHSLYSFATLHHPEHSEDIARVLAVPAKRTDHRIVEFLTDEEVTELLEQPDRGTRTGRRDHVMLPCRYKPNDPLLAFLEAL